jgi:hypothetical protein
MKTTKNEIAAAIKTLDDHARDGLGVCGCWECQGANEIVRGLSFWDVSEALKEGRVESLDQSRRDYEEVINS